MWRRFAILLLLLEEYPLGRDHLNNVIISEELQIFISIFGHFIHSTLLKETRHLQFNRAGRNVEFALHPQHATSRDSEIHTNEDLKNKFRKQPGSLSIILLNSQDKEEALEC